MQAGDRFRGGSEGGIAGCRVPAPARLDELDLVRVQAAHGRYGQLTARRAGRVRLGYRFGGRVQRGVLGEHLGQRGGAVRGRDVGGEDLDGHRGGVSTASMARTAWAVRMAPWNSAVRSAGISRGTHVATTAGQPSPSMACVKYPI